MMNRTTKGLKGLMALALGATVSLPLEIGTPVQAQPDENNAAKAVNPPNRRGGARRAGRGAGNAERMRARLEEREMAAAEAVAGKPLTDEQKQKVRAAFTAREEATRAAREKYVGELAASLGMEPDEVRLKLRDANVRRNQAGMGAAAAEGGGRGARGGRAGRAGRRNRGAAGTAAGGAAAPAVQ